MNEDEEIDLEKYKNGEYGEEKTADIERQLDNFRLNKSVIADRITNQLLLLSVMSLMLGTVIVLPEMNPMLRFGSIFLLLTSVVIGNIQVIGKIDRQEDIVEGLIQEKWTNWIPEQYERPLSVKLQSIIDDIDTEDMNQTRRDYYISKIKNTFVEHSENHLNSRNA